MRLLARIDAPHTPESLKRLAEVEVLRKVLEQRYGLQSDGEWLVHHPREMPEHADRIESPYEVEARYATKRGLKWVGYKVHLTESCDDEYERYSPQGRADPARGIRQFVVGTGGAAENCPIGDPMENTEVYNDETDGVLRLKLEQNGYEWRFVPVEGGTFSDSGSTGCH
jgi:hypothetical protein